MPEPIAAAAHYLVAQNIPVGSHVAVFDLGGGTFDTAILRRTVAEFELVGQPGGDANFGGEDLDEMLQDVVAGHARARDEQAWKELWTANDASGRRNRVLLRQEIVGLKHALSDYSTATINVPGYTDEIRITRAEYEAAARPDLERLVGLLEQTIASVGLTPSALAAIYLTGNASRMPAIADVVAQRFGRQPDGAR